jgi:hypothetical protein
MLKRVNSCADWVTLPGGPRIQRTKYDAAMKDRNLRGHVLAIQRPGRAHGPAFMALSRQNWFSTEDGRVEFEF